MIKTTNFRNGMKMEMKLVVRERVAKFYDKNGNFSHEVKEVNDSQFDWTIEAHTKEYNQFQFIKNLKKKMLGY